MRKTVLAFALGFAAMFSLAAMTRPPIEQLVEGQQQCGGGTAVCVGDNKHAVRVQGPMLMDKPLYPTAALTSVTVDGGLIVTGNVQVNGTLTTSGLYPSAAITTLDAGQVFVQNRFQAGGTSLFSGAMTVNATETATVVDAGTLCVQSNACATRLIGFTTAGIDFASVTTTCTDSAGTTVTGAQTTDTCVLGMPSTLTSGGTGLNASYTCYVSAANTIKVRHCAAGTADDPASVTFTGFVISQQ